MDRLTIFIFFVFICIVGLIRQRRLLKFIAEELNFTFDYIEQLAKYRESEGTNTQAYSFLIQHSVEMQQNLGSHGLARYYKPAYQNYVMYNYEIITNLIPELRRETWHGRFFDEYINTIFECLLRYIGVKEKILNQLKQDFFNPIIWFREGIKTAISIPLFILASLGIFSTSFSRMISHGRFFRLASNIISAISFLSAIMGLIIGWDEFVIFLNKIANLIW